MCGWQVSPQRADWLRLGWRIAMEDSDMIETGSVSGTARQLHEKGR
jgi:hypothetical protein